MTKTKKLTLCRCKECGEYFVGEVKRWVMYECPNKCCAVDIEEEYTRQVGPVEIIRTLRVKE